MSTTLTDQEHQALAAFAQTHGRQWKLALRDAWMTGVYPHGSAVGTLQSLRNASYFGPAGLVKHKAGKSPSLPTAGA